MREYTILRNMSAASTVEPFGRRARSLGRDAVAVPPVPAVDVARLTSRQVREVARDPEVQGIAPVMPISLIRPFEVASAQAANSAWGVGAVKADTSDFTGAGVTVSVLDTGIDAGHPAFRGVEIIQRDFSGSGIGDVQGHGTHCAGTIFGRDVDGTRIGVARGVGKALIGKVLGDDGSGDSDMIFRGIQWAVQEGAQVISMSLGFDFPGLVASLVKDGWPPELATSVALEAYRGNLRMFDALMEMVEARAAFSAGTVLIAAAGNESRRDQNKDFEIAVSIPAAAQGIISVGALGERGATLDVAPFSNTFPQVSAPGVNVLSAKRGGGLVAFSGTSMATPHVAGVAALWWEAMKATPTGIAAAAVSAKLLATARTDVFTPEVDPADRGLGLVTSP
jgi:subtilisin family serine protease